MFNSTILEVVIGLVFLYLIFSLLTTFINETISTAVRYRARHLRKTIKNMMDNHTEEGKNLFEKFHKHPLLKSFAANKKSGFPSYIEPNKFAKIVADIFEKEKNDKSKDSLRENLKNLPEHNYLRQVLTSYLDKNEKTASEKVENVQKLEKHIEDWFNTVMERTSGWYNRNIKAWTMGIALVIAIAFNFDSISVYQRLTKDSNVRQDLVKYAEASINKYAQYVEIDTTITESDTLYTQQLDSLKTQINSILNEEIESIESLAGIGWDKEKWDDLFHSFWGFIVILFGWIITALAISLGAPFWFDLLDKVMKLRGTGKKQEVPKNMN